MNTKFYLGQILLAIIHDDPACGCYLLLPVQPFQLSPKDFIFTCQNPTDGARLLTDMVGGPAAFGLLRQEQTNL